jgi:hypothetical protein
MQQRAGSWDYFLRWPDVMALDTLLVRDRLSGR